MVLTFILPGLIIFPNDRFFLSSNRVQHMPFSHSNLEMRRLMPVLGLQRKKKKKTCDVAALANRKRCSAYRITRPRCNWGSNYWGTAGLFIQVHEGLMITSAYIDANHLAAANAFWNCSFPLRAQNRVEERHFYNINNRITESGHLKEPC